MMMHRVQHNYDGEWIDAVREDIHCDDLPAIFYTAEEANAFIGVLCGIMHMGGDPARFRTLPVSVEDADTLFYNRPERPLDKL